MLLDDLTRRRYHLVTFKPHMGQKKARARATCGVSSCFNFGSGLFYISLIHEMLETGHPWNGRVEDSIYLFIFWEKTVLWGMDFTRVRIFDLRLVGVSKTNSQFVTKTMFSASLGICN